MTELAIVAIDRLLAPQPEQPLVRPRAVGQYHEHGFSFHVPFRMRRATRAFLKDQGQVFGFQLERIGITGRAVCTFYRKDADSVRRFIAEVLGARSVAFIETIHRGED